MMLVQKAYEKELCFRRGSFDVCKKTTMQAKEVEVDEGERY